MVELQNLADKFRGIACQYISGEMSATEYLKKNRDLETFLNNQNIPLDDFVKLTL